jgi:glyoxylase-like metal-dependent hydrolase (beta-lactamase superfamily II)
MKIHAIKTGTVGVKTRQVEGVGDGIRRQLNMLLDREWTEPLPTYAYAIEHPEGVIVVDTGETARTSEAGYFPRWHPALRYGTRMWVAPEEEIGPQLQALGITPKDVPRVVMTHMHTDHAGGLHHFPHSEILVSPTELKLAGGTKGRLLGYPNRRWPTWFAPTAIDLKPEPFGPFPQSLTLTQAGDVRIVPLPGHTPGHIGVIVDDGDHSVLLAGDASYTQDLMLRGAVDGVSPDEAVASTTLERIRSFASTTPTVYVVAHDPETGVRIAERTVIDTRPLEMIAQ